MKRRVTTACLVTAHFLRAEQHTSKAVRWYLPSVRSCHAGGQRFLHVFAAGSLCCCTDQMKMERFDWACVQWRSIISSDLLLPLFSWSRIITGSVNQHRYTTPRPALTITDDRPLTADTAGLTWVKVGVNSWQTLTSTFLSAFAWPSEVTWADYAGTWTLVHFCLRLMRIKESWIRIGFYRGKKKVKKRPILINIVLTFTGRLSCSTWKCGDWKSFVLAAAELFNLQPSLCLLSSLQLCLPPVTASVLTERWVFVRERKGEDSDREGDERWRGRSEDTPASSAGGPCCWLSRGLLWRCSVPWGCGARRWDFWLPLMRFLWSSLASSS